MSICEPRGHWAEPKPSFLGFFLIGVTSRAELGLVSPLLCRWDDCKGNLKKHILAVHRNYHNSKKDYRCDSCDKTFSTKANLMKHIKVIHQSAQFNCHLCSKVFIYKHLLIKHISAVHYNIRDYKCESCDTGFKNRSNLQRHISTVHENIKHH